jgi:hypothetical protein
MRRQCVAVLAEDVVAIGQVVSGLAHAMDDGDGVRFASYFADAGSLVLPGGVELRRTDLPHFVEVRHETRAGSRHVVGSISVDELSGPTVRARARSYALFLPAGTGGGSLCVVYEDDCLQVDAGRWLIERRRIVESTDS